MTQCTSQSTRELLSLSFPFLFPLSSIFSDYLLMHLKFSCSHPVAASALGHVMDCHPPSPSNPSTSEPAFLYVLASAVCPCLCPHRSSTRPPTQICVPLIPSVSPLSADPSPHLPLTRSDTRLFTNVWCGRGNVPPLHDDARHGAVPPVRRRLDGQGKMPGPSHVHSQGSEPKDHSRHRARHDSLCLFLRFRKPRRCT